CDTSYASMSMSLSIRLVAIRVFHSIRARPLDGLTLPRGASRQRDAPLSIIRPDDIDPTEGIVLGGQGNVVLVQTFDAIGQSFSDATVVPDRAGFLATSAKRLRDMLAQPDAYRLGQADRLAPLLEEGMGEERLSE